MATTLRVLTFNVYMDGHLDARGARATCASICSIDADVVCLQETNRKWTHVFESHQALVAAYPHRCHYHDRFPHGGAAVLSKFPFLGLPAAQQQISETDCDDKTFSARIFWGWYGALRVQVQVAQRVWQFLVVHLRAPFPSNPLRVQQQRREEIRAHFDRLMRPTFGQQPTVVLGDFNTKSGPCLEFLREVGMASAYGSMVARQYTWKWCMLQNLFDHIWFDEENVRLVEEAKVLYDKRGGSDHYPVLASFSIA